MDFGVGVIMSLIFSQLVCIPFLRRPFQSLEDPAGYGMVNTENVRIPVMEVEGKDLGAW
jgi:hypothetical protein